MTITSPKPVAKTLKANGNIEGMQMQSIYSYNSTNDLDKTIFAMFAVGQPCDIYQSPFVVNPVLLFDLEFGLTPEGQSFLDSV